MTIKISELQHLLNQFEGLEGLQVTGNDYTILTKENPVMIHGAVFVYGSYYAYDMQVDINRFKNADDILELVGKLNEAFDGLKKQVKSTETH
jgi:hypothetical protein